MNRSGSLGAIISSSAKEQIPSPFRVLLVELRLAGVLGDTVAVNVQLQVGHDVGENRPVTEVARAKSGEKDATVVAAAESAGLKRCSTAAAGLRSPSKASQQRGASVAANFYLKGRPRETVLL